MTGQLSPAQKAAATRRANAALRASSAQASVLTFCEPGAIAALPEADLLALFAAVGAAVRDRCLMLRPALSSWQAVIDYLKSQMAYRETEQFRVLFLDKRNCLIADEAMGEGTVDHVPVYPREVAKRALALNATAMILVHNHPSGDTTPSHADIAMTRTLADCVSPFGISVHDHIVIGRSGHTSMKGQKLF